MEALERVAVLQVGLDPVGQRRGIVHRSALTASTFAKLLDEVEKGLANLGDLRVHFRGGTGERPRVVGVVVAERNAFDDMRDEFMVKSEAIVFGAYSWAPGEHLRS